ncbi:MAG: fumarate hydratase, partial [Desulfobulbus sp.]|nr:fumarate hydratase [Desulfobulbus sp.]
MAGFVYQDPFPLGKDETKYRLLEGSAKYVSIADCNGQEILKVDPEALRVLTSQAMREVSFLLRPAHNEQVAKIFADPESSENDKQVALAMLCNAEVSANFILPFCQDTGTACVVAKKGQGVWTGCDDAEMISAGVYDTYTKENLRYSQNAPLTMYEEVNTKTNLPAQI